MNDPAERGILCVVTIGIGHGMRRMVPHQVRNVEPCHRMLRLIDVVAELAQPHPFQNGYGREQQDARQQSRGPVIPASSFRHRPEPLHGGCHGKGRNVRRQLGLPFNLIHRISGSHLYWLQLLAVWTKPESLFLTSKTALQL